MPISPPRPIGAFVLAAACLVGAPSATRGGDEKGLGPLRYPATERISGWEVDLSAYTAFPPDDVQEGKDWAARFLKQVEKRPGTRDVHVLTGFNIDVYPFKNASRQEGGFAKAEPRPVPLVVLPALDPVMPPPVWEYYTAGRACALYFERGAISLPLELEGAAPIGFRTGLVPHYGPADLLFVGRVTAADPTVFWPLDEVHRKLFVGHPRGAVVTGTLDVTRFAAANPRGLLAGFRGADGEPRPMPCFALLDASGMDGGQSRLVERSGRFGREVTVEFEATTFGDRPIDRLPYPFPESENFFYSDVVYLPASAAKQSVAWAVRLAPGSTPFREGYVVCPLDKHPELPLEMLVVFAGGDVGQAAKRFNDADGWAK